MYSRLRGLDADRYAGTINGEIEKFIVKVKAA